MCRWSHSLGYLGPCTEHRLSAVSWYCIPTCRNRTFTLSHIQLKQMKKLWYKHDTSFIKQCKFHTTAQRKCIKWWNKHNGNIIQNILWTQIWQNSFAHTRRNHGLIVAFSFCQCLYNACFCVIFLLLGTCFVQFVALLLSVQLSAWNDSCLKRVEWDVKPYLLLTTVHTRKPTDAVTVPGLSHVSCLSETIVFCRDIFSLAQPWHILVVMSRSESATCS